jgi:DNA excision repair protein ERCC-4
MKSDRPFSLPALRSIGNLGGTQPTLVVDSREQNSLPFTRLQSVRGTLTSGDYSILGMEELFSVERKSVADLIACCMGERARFERELHRLRGMRFKRLLVVGSELDIQHGQYRSSITPKAVFATLSAFEIRYDCPVVFRGTPELAGRQVESWAFWFAREIIEVVNDMWRKRPAQAGVDSTVQKE